MNQSGELTVPINAPTAQFSIRRANGTGSGTLPFDVADGCNVWKTLAGGGPNAWGGAHDEGLGAPASGESASATAPPERPTTQTHAAPPSPSPAPLRSCDSQQANVRLVTSKTRQGQMQAVIVAETAPGAPPNHLRSIRIVGINNAAVTLNGSPVSAGQTIALPEGEQQATLLLDRHAPEQDPGLASGVAFSVTDACGEKKTFVGGGPSGF